MSPNPTWSKNGYTNLKVEDERLAALQQPDRFWFPVGGTRELVFVDDASFQIHEHNPRISGDSKNWFTCLSGVADDVVCCRLLNRSFPKYLAGYYTVVETSATTDKKGNTHQYGIKLLDAKFNTLKKFEQKQADRVAQDGVGMAGSLYKTSRTGEKSPACGEDYEFQRRAVMENLFNVVTYRGKSLKDAFAKACGNQVEIDKLKRVFQIEVDENLQVVPKLVPFNYESVLRPRNPQSIKELLMGGVEAPSWQKGGAEDSGAKAGADESVPF